MTPKLKTYLLKLSTDAKALEAFKKSPVKAMKAAKLDDQEIVTVLSGDLSSASLKPASHMVDVQVICTVGGTIAKKAPKAKAKPKK
jgi:hypothetical protein